eukprot:TRINITY_DN68372_c0_g1_i1.p1 TRINITY_DN68372_c0_g1~~TRINITY_DN68372_c0_g1_i1.p1  ORF type:complete len:349 (+),score=79.14 TRINITY_DN68372_c0_g1_i1:79-1047(+)
MAAMPTRTPTNPTAASGSALSTLQNREKFRVSTLNAKAVCRILSLLLWSRDPVCRIVVSDTGLRVHMSDGGKCVHATALIREELFNEVVTAGPGTNVCFGVNLSHLIYAFGMTGPGPQLVPLVMRYPGPDGSVLIETVDGDHSTSCALAAKVWDGDYLDLAFAKHEVLLKASMKAELLKEVVTDMEQMNTDALDVAFSQEKQSITFTGGTPSTGTVSIEASTHVSNQLLSSIEVVRSGTTTLALGHLAHTIKTDYFKEIASKTAVASDHVTFRVNAVGAVSLVFHIKSAEAAATCGVECTILPLYRAQADGGDAVQMTPMGL